VRLCITSGTYHPDVGGPPTYLYALSDELVRRGHALKVVTHGEPGGSYSYPISRISRDLPAPMRLARFAVATLRAGRGADLLYVNDYGLPPALANLALCKPLVMKIVGDFAWEYAIRHGLVPREVGIDECQGRRFASPIERLRVMQTWYARRADLIITPSAYLADLVADWGVPRAKLRVIYNAPTPVPAGPSRETLRREIGFGGDEVVVATLARLAPWKGIDVLIDALGQARARAPSLRLLVVGDGEERCALERRAAALDGAVRFVGEVSRERARALLTAADGLALVSAYEGLSHVLLEAMEQGKPIVATGIPGNHELIRDGENGMLVPYGDVPALSRALSRLATQPAAARQLGSQAGADALARSWPRLVEATLGVFEEALAMHRGSTGVAGAGAISW
jgi:glycosyltransferase involved in cell wall biosynthesis